MARMHRSLAWMVAASASATIGPLIAQPDSAPAVEERAQVKPELPAGSQPEAEDQRSQTATRDPLPSDGPAFEVSRILLSYHRPHSQQPLLLAFRQIPVRLLEASDGSLVAPRGPAGSEGEVEIALNQLADSDVRAMRVSAINAISAAMVGEFNRRGLVGVFVSPDQTEIDVVTLDDLRPESQKTLRLVIYTGSVKTLKTIASGERFSTGTEAGDRSPENLPAHRQIREQSPVQPAPIIDEPGDLIRRRLIDEYVFRLNRHPGRRVDVAIAPAGDLDEAELQYLVRENRPWSVYFQFANTGTEQTSEWRERFGLNHTQLTGNDDILSIDYITASFDDTNGVFGSYDSPIGSSQRWRYRLYGDVTDYRASDVGQANEDFSGDGWTTEAQLLYNFHQDGDFFVDAFAGGRFKQIGVSNDVVAITGRETFFIPTVGIRAERRRDTDSFVAELALDVSLPGVTGVSREGSQELGRLDVDTDWFAVKGGLSYSFFLEPLLNPDGWRDPTTPESSTLAHEVVLSLRGQYTDSRLVPQEQLIAGGLFTVRGYPESIASGDSGYVFSGEYRFHLPRSLGVEPEPRRFFGDTFRVAPQQVYSAPDWDLILRGFVDAAQTFNTDRRSFESDNTLVGIGAGLEVQIKRNFNARVDFGVALSEVESAGVDSGDSRFNFLFTLLY